MTVEIKILGKGDEEILANVAQGVFDQDIDRDLAVEFLNDPRHHIAVAIDGKLVVGMASAVHYIHPDKPPQLWINEVGVSPSHQKRGLVKALLHALLEIGCQYECTEAWVLTEADNEAAMNLYTSVGGVQNPQIMFKMACKTRAAT